METIAKDYYSAISSALREIAVSTKNENLKTFYQGIEYASQLILNTTEKGNKLLFIGNGASQAISSHMSTDYWKNGGMRAIAFTDPSTLTCIGNDYGYEYIFEKPLSMFADIGDILIAISSSGQSSNILKAVNAAREKKCYVITLSGFKSENPLRKLGDINFYVPNNSYGPVEIIHHSICHCILDTICEYRNK